MDPGAARRGRERGLETLDGFRPAVVARGEIGALDERDARRVRLEQRRALELAAEVHAGTRGPVVVRQRERYLGRLRVELVSRQGRLERRLEARLGRILQRDGLGFRLALLAIVAERDGPVRRFAPKPRLIGQRVGPSDL